jgi:hypothetical protein
MTRRRIIILSGLLLSVAICLGVTLSLHEKPEQAGQHSQPVAAQTYRKADKPSPENSGQATQSAAIESPPLKEKSIMPNTIASPQEPYVSYSETIMQMLGIDEAGLFDESGKYKNSVAYVEWMDRVRNVLKNIDPEKLSAIMKNQAMHLYLKDKLNEAYLTGQMDHETFLKAVADLMKFQQRTYQSMLSDADYQALFEVSPEATDQYIDQFVEATPRYGFILNQMIPATEVVSQIPSYKMEEVNASFKKMIYERDQINKMIEDGSMPLEQARQAMQESQQTFVDNCKMILSEGEIDTIFGSVENLETGTVSEGPPAIQKGRDQAELGFEVENPTTSIEMVKKTLNQAKIDDIKLLFEQREQERQKLIQMLNAGEIAEQQIETISAQMDAVYAENCRAILTDQQYQLIFAKKQE